MGSGNILQVIVIVIVLKTRYYAEYLTGHLGIIQIMRTQHLSLFMKNNISLVKHATRSLTAIALLLFSTVSFSQNETLNLGMLTSFEAYTVAGAVANSGGAVTGDIGTGFGIISGFSDPPSTGNHYTANAATKQAQYDLLRLYIHLNALPVNFPDPFVPASTAHSPVFGVGEVLAPGVYSIGGAGSISGALTLDGGGDPDAVFVIKMNGAMTVDAGATVSLAPGTKSANVFWLINGAISVAAGADIKGTLFSKSGAVGLGANVSLEGRMLTMGGAITFGIGSTAILPPDATTIPIYCEADCTPAAAANILGVLSDFALFASAGAVGNTGITGINGLIGAHAGSIAGYTPGGTHIGTEEIANLLTAQAAADLDDAYIALMAMTPTVAHAATFLNETLAPGVYNIPTAGSLGGTVILDAGGDPDAIFVFKFAGAFNVAALSKIILANGAKRCNVFWLGGAGVATGAVNIGAFSEVSGYFIANNAASNSGNGVFLAGGQFSNSGAVNTNTAVIYDNPECIDSPILTPDPACGLVKTASIGGTGTGLLGEVITYTFEVTNIGPQTLTNVAVTDDMPGLVITGSPIANLASGEVKTITGTYTITQADNDTGSVTNSALARDANAVMDISGTATDNDDPTITTVTQSPGIALVKTASIGGTGTGLLGEVIAYTFAVTNTGPTVLTNIAVTDPMVGLVITGSPISALGVGTATSTAITGTYTITQADIDAGGVTNTATATDENGVTDISGTAIDNDAPTVTTVSHSPSVALVKTASIGGTGTGLLGEVITYTFPVTNTGSTTLTNIVVADPMLGLVISGSPIVTLAPGASSSAITGTYTITQADINAGSVTNTATATDANGVTDISGTAIDNDDPTVTLTPTFGLPDFTPTIDIDELVFITGGPAIDFVVTIAEINNGPSDGLIVFNIIKPTAFEITFAANTVNSVVNGNTAVNNADWDLVDNGTSIQATLKPGLSIGQNGVSSIGFSIVRGAGIPAETVQAITVTLVNGSGADSSTNDNTYHVNVKAQ
jgi:hypothetical protein